MIEKVTSRLFTGPKLTPQILHSCTTNGISHILNVAQELLDYPLSTNQPFTFLKIGLLDNPGHNLPQPQHLISQIQLVTSEILQDPQNKLLIHCNAGKHRSISCAYLVLKTFGLSNQQSYPLLPGGSAPAYGAQIDRFLHSYRS